MSTPRSFYLGLVVLALTSLSSQTSMAQSNSKIQHVLLISIDGMHSLDFSNWAKGVPAFGSQPYCPHQYVESCLSDCRLTQKTNHFCAEQLADLLWHQTAEPVRT